MMFVQLKIVRKKTIKCTLQGLIDADCGGSLFVTERTFLSHSVNPSFTHSHSPATSLEWYRNAYSFGLVEGVTSICGWLVSRSVIIF